MNRQELLTHVVTGLRRQGRKTVDNFYADAQGAKCPFGLLIERYEPSMEDFSVFELNDYGYFVQELSDGEMGLMLALRKIHDKRPVADWERAWTELASAEGLTIPR